MSQAIEVGVKDFAGLADAGVGMLIGPKERMPSGPYMPASFIADRERDMAKRDRLWNEEHEEKVEEERARRLGAVPTPPVLVRDAKILADARRHLEAARALPLPVDSRASRWWSWAESVYRRSGEFKTCVEALHFAQSKIPFDHRENADDHRAEMQTSIDMLRSEFFGDDTSDGVGDNPKSVLDTLQYLGDNIVSNIFFWHVRMMMFCQTYCRPKRVLEVGGGYGALARLWLLNKPAALERYVIVDLPECMFFAEVALRDEFGDNIGYWEGKDPGTRVVLVPVQRLAEYTQPSDLIVNVGSLQEMCDSWVSFYMGWLDRYPARFFYSLNYTGQPLTAMADSRSYWSVRPSANWVTRSITADVPLVKMQCASRYFAEMLFEKTPQPPVPMAQWSLLRGAIPSRAVYLEGLDLLRQNFTPDNAHDFIVALILAAKHIKIPIYKEMRPITEYAVKAGKNDLEGFLKECYGVRQEVNY